MLFSRPLLRARLLSEPQRLGKWGEKKSCKFLESKGLRLVMVAPDRSIVFVEVRTRAETGFASAESTVTTAKRRKLISAARYFLRLHRIENRTCRFDVVTVVLGRKGPLKITHYKKAFVV